MSKQGLGRWRGGSGGGVGSVRSVRSEGDGPGDRVAGAVVN